MANIHLYEIDDKCAAAFQWKNEKSALRVKYKFFWFYESAIKMHYCALNSERFLNGRTSRIMTSFNFKFSDFLKDESVWFDVWQSAVSLKKYSTVLNFWISVFFFNTDQITNKFHFLHFYSSFFPLRDRKQ